MHIGDIARPLKPARPVIDTETGEVIHDESDTLGYQLGRIGKMNKAGRRRAIRRYRGKVRRMARNVLLKSETQKGKRFRVCDCGRLPVPKVDEVRVTQSPATGNAEMRGLVTCGQVWTCPVCASKIAVKRRDEVRQALSRHLYEYEQDPDLPKFHKPVFEVDGSPARTGKLAVSITLTVRHGVGHSAAKLLTAMGGALRRMRANRRVIDLRKRYGYQGQIRALEVTYGHANGWHPHFHEVWFFDTKLWSESTAVAMQAEISKAWIAAVVTGGLPAPAADVGCVVKIIDTPRDYEGKGNASIDGVDGDGEGWDAADEITRAIAKTAKRGRMAPFDLLVHGEEGLFREYAKAFQGKRQLTWSPGLKGHFWIEEKDDEEIAGEVEDSEGVPVLAISAVDWIHAVRVHDELAAIVLDLVELRGAEAAVAELQRLGLAARVLAPPE